MEETLGKRIVANRKRLALTQDALAERLGVTAQAVSKWENDQSCPDITMLPKLAEVFDCTTDELLGLQPKTVHTAEIMTVNEEKERAESEGLHEESGTWELKWDGGRRGGLGFALWVLLAGIVMSAGVVLNVHLNFWAVAWFTGLAAFGLFGLYPKFSFFRMGCALFGGYYILKDLHILRLSVRSDWILPAVLILFGLYLLITALKKSREPHFSVSHNGRRLGKNSTHCIYDGETFDCATSFGENHHLITLRRLSGGSASLSFGELEVDLSGCEEIADGCTLELNSSFGELELLVPKRYRVKPNVGTAFASFETKGAPDANADTVIYVNGNVSFGEITLRYL